MTDTEWNILTVGMDPPVISRLFDPIEKETGFVFRHLLDPSIDRAALGGNDDPRFLLFREDVRTGLVGIDEEALADLEGSGLMTIHNMILGDRVVRTLSRLDALTWATFVAKRVEEVFRSVRPSIVIGGYDAVHSGIAQAVARKLGIPWFALSFSTIPPGRMGFCTGMAPGTGFSCLDESDADRLRAAEEALSNFEGRRIAVPKYLSANSVGLILQRLPAHLRSFQTAVVRALRRRYDRYTQYPVSRLASDYVRKRKNLFTLPKKWFVQEPPEQPYFFIGLHMQPESSIDVWEPFFSDQNAVLEAIARSMPPSYRLLVKLHHSDADNHSRAQLDRMRRLPGVQLVSPFVSSRTFIEGASLVLAIQGNIAMEAALLGKPVLIFGDSLFRVMPSVTTVARITELPDQVRAKLSEAPPERDEILRGLATYLRHYAPGCYNDWTKTPTPEEYAAIARHFVALRKLVESREAGRGQEA